MQQVGQEIYDNQNAAAAGATSGPGTGGSGVGSDAGTIEGEYREV